MAESHEDIVALVESLVVALVDEPETVQVVSRDGEGALLVEITVATEDVGKVIGRQGRVIKAIRTVARAAASQAGFAVEVEVLG